MRVVITDMVGGSGLFLQIYDDECVPTRQKRVTFVFADWGVREKLGAAVGKCVVYICSAREAY